MLLLQGTKAARALEIALLQAAEGASHATSAAAACLLQ
jgi:hypothetical protein